MPADGNILSLMGEWAVVTVMCVLGKAEAAGATAHPLIYPSCTLLKDQEVPLELLCVPH